MQKLRTFVFPDFDRLDNGENKSTEVLDLYYSVKFKMHSLVITELFSPEEGAPIALQTYKIPRGKAVYDAFVTCINEAAHERMAYFVP